MKAVSIHLDKEGKITQQILHRKKLHTHTNTHTHIFTKLYEICEIIKAQKATRRMRMVKPNSSKKKESLNIFIYSTPDIRKKGRNLLKRNDDRTKYGCNNVLLAL